MRNLSEEPGYLSISFLSVVDLCNDSKHVLMLIKQLYIIICLTGLKNIGNGLHGLHAIKVRYGF